MIRLIEVRKLSKGENNKVRSMLMRGTITRYSHNGYVAISYKEYNKYKKVTKRGRKKTTFMTETKGQKVNVYRREK